MATQGYSTTLATLQTDGPSLSNSTTATSLIGAATNVSAQAKYTLPANFFYIGKTLRIKAVMRVSNLVTTPGTLTLDVRLGSVIVFNGGAMQLSSTAHTTLPVFVEILLTCRAVGPGTTSNLIGQGTASGLPLSLTAVADSTTSPAGLLIPNTNPAVGTGFDSTAAQQVDLFGTFSIANAANLVQLTQYTLEDIN